MTKPKMLIGCCFLLLIHLVISLPSDFCLRDFRDSLGIDASSDPAVRLSDDAFSYSTRDLRPQSGLGRYGGTAWCPNVLLNSTSYEWMQVDFPRLYAIYTVVTAGDFNSGVGFWKLDAFKIQYRREASSNWIYYSTSADRGEPTVLPGSEDTYTTQFQDVEQIVATSVRIVPVVKRPKNICLRLELIGCRWTSDLVGYKTPHGQYHAGVASELVDIGYDTSDSRVSGLGQLTDAKIGKVPIPKSFMPEGNNWLGWNRTGSVDDVIAIYFRFSSLRNISEISLLSAASLDQGFSPPSEISVWFSKEGLHYQEEPVVASFPEPAADEVYDARVSVAGRVARLVRVDMTMKDEWLALTEVDIKSKLANETDATSVIDVTPSSTTTPSTSPVTSDVTSALLSTYQTSTVTERPSTKTEVSSTTKPVVLVTSGTYSLRPRATPHPDRTTQRADNTEDKIIIGIVLGVVGVLVLMLLCALLLVMFLRHRRRRRKAVLKPPISGGPPLLQFIDSINRPEAYSSPDEASLLHDYSVNAPLQLSAMPVNPPGLPPAGLGTLPELPYLTHRRSTPTFVPGENNYMDYACMDLKPDEFGTTSTFLPTSDSQNSALNHQAGLPSVQRGGLQPIPVEQPLPPLHINDEPPPVFPMPGSEASQQPGELFYAASDVVKDRPVTADLIAQALCNVPPVQTSWGSVALMDNTSTAPRSYSVLPLQPVQPSEADLSRLESRPVVDENSLETGEILAGGTWGQLNVMKSPGLDAPHYTTLLLKLNPTEPSRLELRRELCLLSRLDDIQLPRLLGLCGPDAALIQVSGTTSLKQHLSQYTGVSAPGHYAASPPQSSEISYGAVLHLARQAACGLEHLHGQGLVHRDVAAHSCLLGANQQLTLCSLGPVLHAENYCHVDGKGLLPLRWMAWDTLLTGTFSRASDVWGFGCLLWELMSVCRELPLSQLPDILVVENAKHLLHNSSSAALPQPPQGCSRETANLMQECWKRMDSERPSFNEIRLFLDRKLTGYSPGD